MKASLVLAALAALSLAGAPLPAQQDATGASARISGVVVDSLAAQPLAGALVQLVAADRATQARTVQTSANGAFAFDSVEAGQYLLGFYHPRLDSLGITAPVRQLDVRSGRNVRVPLATPSGATIRTVYCGERARSDTIGVYIGFVRSAGDALPLSRSQVRVQWSEITIGGGGLFRTTPALQAETSEHGGVALCGLPVGGSVLVRAWNGSDSSGFAELEVPASGVLLRDIYVGRAYAEAVREVGADSTMPPATVLRGDGVVRGVVRRPDDEPLPGARVVVLGSGVEDTTSSLGVYGLRALPAGTYTLEVRALGYLPARHPVDIMQRGETVVDHRLEALGTFLDTVKVTAKAVFQSRERREFEMRRRQGFGTFMDEAYIEKRQPFYVADLFRMVPGVRVERGTFGDRVLMRGMGFSESCMPTVFVDGMRVMNLDGDLDAVVNVSAIRLVEVYPRAGIAPSQFQAFEGCGSVVIWTGSRMAIPQRGKR